MTKLNGMTWDLPRDPPGTILVPVRSDCEIEAIDWLVAHEYFGPTPENNLDRIVLQGMINNLRMFAAMRNSQPFVAKFSPENKQQAMEFKLMFGGQ